VALPTIKKLAKAVAKNYTFVHYFCRFLACPNLGAIFAEKGLEYGRAELAFVGRKTDGKRRQWIWPTRHGIPMHFIPKGWKPLAGG
jgi:hypothetical protein